MDKERCDVRVIKLEIEIIKSLKHTNIVELKNLFENEETIYLVMER